MKKSFSHQQRQSAVGAIIGSAVGDALGAPFEFQPSGRYLEHFPEPVLSGAAEMIGGGAFNWKPGEFTDDTQMAIALAESLIECGVSFSPDATWERFVSWASAATDIGITTREALSHDNWATAAQRAHEAIGRTGSNGALMRVAPVGVAGLRFGQQWTISVARDQSHLTHFDPVAGWSAAISAEVIRRLISGATQAEALSGINELVGDEYHTIFGDLLDDAWHPSHNTDRSNGAASICLAQALWALRSTNNFSDAIVSAINLGGDTDTVATVTGAIAGAAYGIQGIPSRWVTPLNGKLRQPDGTTSHYRQRDLQNIASKILGEPASPEQTPEAMSGPTRVHPTGVFAANLAGAIASKKSFAVISLCRIHSEFDEHQASRAFYIVDNGTAHNPRLSEVVEDAVRSIDAFLDDGQEVLVHCHGGRSRTALVLKAWYMRHHGVGHAEAHDWLCEVWPLYSTWNDDFMRFLDSEWQ